MVIFEHFFSDLGAYLCTSTKPSPPRDNELRKKGEENFWSSDISAHGGCLGTDRR